MARDVACVLARRVGGRARRRRCIAAKRRASIGQLRDLPARVPAPAGRRRPLRRVSGRALRSLQVQPDVRAPVRAVRVAPLAARAVPLELAERRPSLSRGRAGALGARGAHRAELSAPRGSPGHAERAEQRAGCGVDHLHVRRAGKIAALAGRGGHGARRFGEDLSARRAHVRHSAPSGHSYGIAGRWSGDSRSTRRGGPSSHSMRASDGSR